MDLIALLAAAPPWVRAAASFVISLWAACTAAAAVMRRIPRERFDAFERAFPRLRHVARFARKFGTDYEPALREIVHAVRLPDDQRKTPVMSEPQVRK